MSDPGTGDREQPGHRPPPGKEQRDARLTKDLLDRDLYGALGVPRTADQDAIKKAYRQLARELHPDYNPGNKEAEERFKEVSAAYHVLSKERWRKEYDYLSDSYQDDNGGSTSREKPYVPTADDLIEYMEYLDERNRREEAERAERLRRNPYPIESERVLRAALRRVELSEREEIAQRAIDDRAWRERSLLIKRARATWKEKESEIFDDIDAENAIDKERDRAYAQADEAYERRYATQAVSSAGEDKSWRRRFMSEQPVPVELAHDFEQAVVTLLGEDGSSRSYRLPNGEIYRVAQMAGGGKSELGLMKPASVVTTIEYIGDRRLSRKGLFVRSRGIRVEREEETGKIWLDRISQVYDLRQSTLGESPQLFSWETHYPEDGEDPYDVLVTEGDVAKRDVDYYLAVVRHYNRSL